MSLKNSFFLVILLSILLLFSTGTATASVSILMKMVPIGTELREYVVPNEKFTLSFKMLEGSIQEKVGGIVIDIIFDPDILSISTNLDVTIADDIKDKKTLYKNLIDNNKLRVLLIGFNDKIIPAGSNLFTARFKAIRKPPVIPGTIIYHHPSSSTITAEGITTTGNSLFIPIFESSPFLSKISGKVTDSQTVQGIPGVLVGLINEIRPDILYQTLTDPLGDYVISNLIDGTYTILALKDGYSASMEKNLVFERGNTVIKNIALRKGIVDFGFVYPATSVEEPFVTSLPMLRVYGIADANVYGVAVKGRYLNNYTPGDFIWNEMISLNQGENLITANAYNQKGDLLDTASIMINRSSEDNFKINKPTVNEAYETSISPISIGGITTIYTSVIYQIHNGQEIPISTYNAGETSWETLVDLNSGLNYLDFSARRADGSAVGTDSITVKYNPSGPSIQQLIITSPTSADYYKTGHANINIGGQTPSTTKSITMNDEDVSSYIPGSTFWSVSSGTLTTGAGNYFTFKAFDASGDSLGTDSITIEYDSDYTDEDLFKITTPTENSSYTHSAETPQITIGGTSQPSTYLIRLNGLSITGYQPGSTSWSTSYTLESGVNHITAVAYNSQNLEIGTDTIAITFIFNFGGMKITMPDEGNFETTQKTVHIGGQTDIQTNEIMVNEKLLPEYVPGRSTWYYDTSVSLGENSFVFTAYDSSNNIIGRDEITITNPGVLKIISPTESEDYETEKKNLRIQGTVTTEKSPITKTIKINGKTLREYESACPYFSHETELAYSENYFYVLAYDESSQTIPIGMDFIKIIYREIIDPPFMQILNPAMRTVIVQENTIAITGETPSSTRVIYRLKDEKRIGISYTPYTISWVDSAELKLGKNFIKYEAADQTGDCIDSVDLLVISTGVMRIIEPVSNSIFYETEENDIAITLQTETPGDRLLVNNKEMPGYSGQSIIHYSHDLDEDNNTFEFALFDSFGEQIGYSLLHVSRNIDTSKNKIGACFIDSITILQ
ncbi:MAG: carboxypeptidase-like regulatory domain-containing protein [bacterium]